MKWNDQLALRGSMWGCRLALLVAAACSSDADGAGGTAGSANDPNGGSGEPGSGGNGPSNAGGNGFGDGPGSGGNDGQGDPLPLDPGSDVQLSVAPDVLDPILADVERARSRDAAALIAERAVPFETELGYDPRESLGLDALQSHFGLSEPALARFVENGFVILPDRQYPSFPYGYFDIYGADLPVYVTADMVLEAVHRSYDDILATLERQELSPRLARLLTGMRARLAAGALEGQAAADADFYIAVALGLLTDEPATTLTGLDPEGVRSFVSKAKQASGSEVTTIFGTRREVDFSQFMPRGHYANDSILEPYFRAMMWLGRIDMRLIETQDTGGQVFWRRQLEAALALDSLLDAATRHDWEVIDHVVGIFVGEHDSMTVPELATLLTDLGTTREAGLGSRSDAAIAQTIVDGQYGAQRIASRIIRRVPGPGPLPLDASFAFFGQRYTVDSHVFSNVVYDRVDTRVLPSPLDAAFAAFGNDHAVALLSGELSERPYAGALASMRVLVDAHPSEYWQGSLYTSWLDALRTLSPQASGGADDGTAASVAAAGLPALARREPWARRMLNTQLASWAQLRHDTLLYAKQSYTAGSVCEYPDAYVEPYPEFFHAIARYAELGLGIAAELELETLADYSLSNSITSHFSNVRRIVELLAGMAELQRSGMPHSAEQLAFINQAVRIESGGSGPPFHDGWYRDLFFDPSAALDLDPTIADVHTDPGGDTPIARGPSVLHVGTGMPRAMIVSIDTCAGPRAYAGVVHSFHEHLEPSLARLTDEQWLESLRQTPPAEEPWLAPVLAAP
ncbi:MAG TPA: DUF3160 domain-containing protein [Polyangiaceae bacterium]|nr:DUF3160 domain-containing protein [Polyangiaceae bacterium]